MAFIDSILTRVNELRGGAVKRFGRRDGRLVEKHRNCHSIFLHTSFSTDGFSHSEIISDGKVQSNFVYENVKT